MIGVIFSYGSEMIEVRIDKTNCYFRTHQFGGALAPIDSIKIDKAGSIKEHPDLVDRADWREETIKRFKEKLKNYKTEMERVKYVIDDLSKVGYKPIYIQREGFRPQKIKIGKENGLARKPIQ